MTIIRVQNSAVFQWLRARLLYLQCFSNGDTEVLHWGIDLKLEKTFWAFSSEMIYGVLSVFQKKNEILKVHCIWISINFTISFQVSLLAVAMETTDLLLVFTDLYLQVNKTTLLSHLVLCKIILIKIPEKLFEPQASVTSVKNECHIHFKDVLFET